VWPRWAAVATSDTCDVFRQQGRVSSNAAWLSRPAGQHSFNAIPQHKSASAARVVSNPRVHCVLHMHTHSCLHRQMSRIRDNHAVLGGRHTPLCHLRPARFPRNSNVHIQRWIVLCVLPSMFVVCMLCTARDLLVLHGLQRMLLQCCSPHGCLWRPDYLHQCFTQLFPVTCSRQARTARPCH
jgi:hypothetical protein